MPPSLNDQALIVGDELLPLSPWKEYNILVPDNKKKTQKTVPKDIGHIPFLSHHNTSENIVNQRSEHGSSSSVVSSSKAFGSFHRDNKTNKTRKSSLRTSIKRKKNVYFNETATILWIESIDDMSVYELYSCYYSSQDYVNFREREKNLHKQLSCWGTIQSPDEDMMGLETRIQRHHRKDRSRESIYAVIFEQEMNRDLVNRASDDLIIAAIYKQCTETSSRLAYNRAMFNSSEVGTNTKGGYEYHPSTSRYDDDNSDDDEASAADEAYNMLKCSKVPRMEITSLSNAGSVMMKYAVACIPPSPASLRLGHDQFLEMPEQHPDDELGATSSCSNDEKERKNEDSIATTKEMPPSIQKDPPKKQEMERHNDDAMVDSTKSANHRHHHHHRQKGPHSSPIYPFAPHTAWYPNGGGTQQQRHPHRHQHHHDAQQHSQSLSPPQQANSQHWGWNPVYVPPAPQRMMPYHMY
jgi:hypothetical protein